MLKILVIDDDERIRKLLQIGLSRSGKYEIITAADGPAGLAMARKMLPDLVILDLNMPGQNGLEVLRNIREIRKTSLTPVIILTGEEDSEKVKTAMADYAEQYMIKPVDVSYMEKRIGEILAIRAPSRNKDGAPKWRL